MLQLASTAKRFRLLLASCWSLILLGPWKAVAATERRALAIPLRFGLALVAAAVFCLPRVESETIHFGISVPAKL